MRTVRFLMLTLFLATIAVPLAAAPRDDRGNSPVLQQVMAKIRKFISGTLDVIILPHP